MKYSQNETNRVKGLWLGESGTKASLPGFISISGSFSGLFTCGFMRYEK
ncbi:MAG: hypothetical protein ACRBBP_04950 [Bdellovibrionales bacterium]